MRGLPPDKSRRILDVGCGRGGTADYLQKRGWGRVLGFDIDEVSIAYAQARYPQVEFLACDVLAASRRLTGHYDLICLFTTLYALPDQPAALRELRCLAAPRSRLLVFDYLNLAASADTLPVREESGTVWKPLQLQDLPRLFGDAGWSILKTDDLSLKFGAWYSDLVSRIEARQADIIQQEGHDWFRFVRDFYRGMLASLQEGRLGGVLVIAQTE